MGWNCFWKSIRYSEKAKIFLKKHTSQFLWHYVKQVGRFFSNFVAFSEHLNFVFSTTCVFLKDQSYYCVDILEGRKRDCSFRYDFNPLHIHLETLALRYIYFAGFEIIQLYTFSSFQRTWSIVWVFRWACPIRSTKIGTYPYSLCTLSAYNALHRRPTTLELT